jgi:hypothetical protein
MARSEITSGICGFTTAVRADLDATAPYEIHLEIETDCPNVRALADELRQVNALEEITYRRGMPHTIECAASTLGHPACPVPSGILKAIEVAAGLALPKDAVIKVWKD